jgi:hypothetical protein
MDPYLEVPRRWLDFHNTLAAEIRSRLNEQLDPKYAAWVTTYIVYEEVEVAWQRTIQPDVYVAKTARPREERSAAVGTLAPAPVQSAVPLEAAVHLYRVEIRMTADEELVTVIEILSPSNKRAGHDDSREYQRKRLAVLRSSVHLVEIDLLRGGERPPLTVPVPAAPYYAVVSRAQQRPTVDVWPIQLSERLPVIPVPLMEPDPDTPLDLAGAFASVYDRGPYARVIDYREPPPPPPLSTNERAWVAELLHWSESPEEPR